MEDVFGHRISEGTLVNINSQADGSLAGIRSILHEALLSSPVLHVDEMGFQVQGKRQWLHVASTDQATWYAYHPKWGKEAMDDIGLLPLYEGTMMHDTGSRIFGIPKPNMHYIMPIFSVKFKRYGKSTNMDGRKT